MVSPDIIKELEDIDAMFVQSAIAMEHVGDRVVLRGVAPSTLYFSDRPQRVVGHLATADFIDLWDAGADSFAENPPNAVLAFVGKDAIIPEDVVIEISDPTLRGEELTYTATVLDGALPSWAEGCTLFIDPFGRPLSPVSVAGIRRRTRRRTRRRLTR
jgi:hypothetical protein